MNSIITQKLLSQMVIGLVITIIQLVYFNNPTIVVRSLSTRR